MLGKNRNRRHFREGDMVKVHTPEMIGVAEGVVRGIFKGAIHKIFIPRGVFTNCSGKERFVHNIYAKSDNLVHLTRAG